MAPPTNPPSSLYALLRSSPSKTFNHFNPQPLRLTNPPAPRLLPPHLRLLQHHNLAPPRPEIIHSDPHQHLPHPASYPLLRPIQQTSTLLGPPPLPRGLFRRLHPEQPRHARARRQETDGRVVRRHQGSRLLAAAKERRGKGVCDQGV